jgi:hypothetical protein
LAAVGAGGYGTYESASHGMQGAATLAGLGTVLAAYGAYQEILGAQPAQAGGISNETRSNWARSQLEPASAGGSSDETLARIELGETESVYGPVNEDALSRAQTDMAHVLMNNEAAGETLGQPVTADPRVVTNANRSLYERALNAVRAARAERAAGLDPTGGALHFNMRSTWNQAPFQGHPIVTQYGPFFNDLSRFTMQPYGFKGGGLRTWVYINIYQ